MWTLELLKAADKELSKLPDDVQADFLRVAELLMSHGPQEVREPHVKHLQAKLWEMRLRGEDGIARAVYFTAKGRRIIVVRLFEKKSQKTPRSEIDLAIRRMKEWNDDNR
jgi:phage-related protein